MPNNYETNIKEKKMFDTSGEDFTTPVVFKKFKQSSLNVAPLPNKSKTKNSTRKRQVTLHQMVKENLQYSDVNPEHLQMALALSRSISENETDNRNEEKSWTYDTQKHEKKRTLLEFGFKANKIKLSAENRILSKRETSRINKKSKFRFITPTLCLRTEEDRESLVNSKISLILTQNTQENAWKAKELNSSDIMSEELFKMNCSRCSIFHINSKFDEFSRQSFSVTDLNILEDRAKCGVLLKEWKSIPLREHSPDMFEDRNTKLNEKLEDETKFYSKENLKESEHRTNQSTIDELNPQKLGNSSSNIQKDDESRDCDIRNSVISNEKIEHQTNMYITISPDLFEDQQSRFSIDKPIAESNSAKAKKNLEKLFSKGELSEMQNQNDITMDDTTTLSSNLCFHGCSESQMKRKISTGSSEYPYCTHSHVSENLYISSSSDEGMNNIKKNYPMNIYTNKKDSSSINSIQDEDSYSGDVFEKCSSKCNNTNHSKFIEKNSLELLSMHNYINNSDSDADIDKYDVCTEYTNHNIQIKLISSTSKLDENVSIHNSVVNIESHETNTMNDICCQFEESDDITYIFDENTEEHFRNQSINSKFNLTSDEFLPINKVKSVNNFETVIENSMHGQEKQLSSNVNDIGKHNISEFSLHENKKKNCNMYTAGDPVSCTNQISFHDENYINKSNLVGNMVTSRSVQETLVSTFNEGEKSDKMSFYKTLSESYNNISSLNVTEHIEAMLACSYSPINLNPSDEKSRRTYNNKQPESFEKKKVSIPSSSGDLQHLLSHKIKISENVCDHIVLENIEHRSFGQNIDSPEDVICISDEEMNYSSSIRMNEENLKKNNRIFGSENVAGLNENNGVDQVYKTPLKRCASYTESSTPKQTQSFGRYKSESDATPKRKFIIRTKNITPMINYAELDTPDIVKELGKYGLKPMKRKRGLNLLKHIYEATHPIVESKGRIIDENNKVLKKAKEGKCEIVSKNESSIVLDDMPPEFHSLEPWLETMHESDLIFESKRSTKIPTCQIPLQIVWHNFLVGYPEIRKNILLYEPLQVDIVNKMLKEEGFKFHLQLTKSTSIWSMVCSVLFEV